MKLIKISDKPTDFQNLTALPLIGSPEQLYTYLSKSALTEAEYTSIYQLLISISPQSNKLDILQKQQYNCENNREAFGQVITSSNLNIRKYIPSNNYFQVNPKAKTQTYSVAVPEYVITAYTLPYQAIFTDINIGYAFVDQLYRDTSNGYINSRRQGIIDTMLNKYQGENSNPIKILLQVVEPPQTMTRYINKRIKDWEILHPSTDIGNYYVGSGSNGTLQFVFSKNLSTVGLPSQSKFFAYPSIINYQFQALSQGYANANKLVYTQFSNDGQLIGNATSYITRSIVTNSTYVMYNKQSQYLKTDYSNRNLKNLGISFRLQDKLGYYNSLMPNQDISKPAYYAKQQLSFNSYQPISNFHYNDSSNLTLDLLEPHIFLNNEVSNIASICYSEQNYNNSYGFMHQMGNYRITFDIKIQERVGNSASIVPSKIYNNGNNNLINAFNVLNDSSRNLITLGLLQVRALPINGISQFPSLLSNQNIGIVSKDRLFKKPRTGNPSTYFNRQDISFMYNICNYYNAPTDSEIYNNLQQRQLLQVGFSDNPHILSKMVMKPKNNHSDFNFMFDRYGQFITYRTLNKRYYKFNDKAYIDIFGQTTQQFTQIADGWYRATITINKNFQGNSILSIMLNQTWGGLVTDYKYDLIKLQLKNVEVVKLG